jgi:hypothetical protein
MNADDRSQRKIHPRTLWKNGAVKGKEWKSADANRSMWRRGGTTRAVVSVALVAASFSTGCDRGGAEQSPGTDTPLEDSNASSQWRVVEDLRIGSVDGPEATTFGGLAAVYPASDGGVWVFDGAYGELRFFDEGGQFRMAVGRRGVGPGEFAPNGFGGGICAFPGPEDEIWVEDALRRWQRFDRDGELLGQIRATSNVGCGVRRWTPDGRFFVGTTEMDPRTRESTSIYIVHEMLEDGELSTVDTVPRPSIPPSPSVIWVNPAGRVRSLKYIPFVHQAGSILGPNGDFWITEGDGSYSMRRESVYGDTLAVFQREYSPVAIPPSIRRDSIQAFRPEGWTAEGGFDADQVPRFYPPFDSYFVGADGALWVRRTIENGAAALELFASDGVYLGEVEVPAEFARMLIRYATTEFLYGVLRDDLNIAYAVRLRIVRP